MTEALKPSVISFKHKNDTDLFGLGIQEETPAAKDSSEDQEGEILNVLPDRHLHKLWLFVWRTLMRLWSVGIHSASPDDPVILDYMYR